MPFPPPADNIPKGLSAEGGFGLTLGRSQLSSFKLKLVAYFVLLSLIPLAATYWGFSTVAGAGGSRQVTLRQEAGLRAALTLYQQRAERAQAEAEQARALAIAAERARAPRPPGAATDPRP